MGPTHHVQPQLEQFKQVSRVRAEVASLQQTREDRLIDLCIE